MRIFFLFLCFSFVGLRSISLVYNLKIAQTTRRTNLATGDDHPWIMGLTTAGQFKKLYNGGHQTVIGELATLIYNTQRAYIHIDVAGGNIAQHDKGICISRTQADDILFSGGYSRDLGTNGKYSISGLLGLPLHKDDAFLFQGLEFGTGHVGIGGQIDGSYRFSDDQSTLFGAARIIHFFSRTVQIPVLEKLQCFTFDLGNFADLLLAYSHNWTPRHKIEIGYNPTFAFSAHLQPPLPTAIHEDRLFIRSSFYAAYQHGFLIDDKYPSAIIAGLSYGFDHSKLPLLNKSIVSVWFTWGISF